MKKYALCALLVASCTAPPTLPGADSRLPSTPAAGLAEPIPASAATVRQWHLVPDGLPADPVRLTVSFAGDPTAGAPRAQLGNGREVPLRPEAGGAWQAELPLDGLDPGPHRVEIVERLASGKNVTVAMATFTVSQPEYVVWTLDFEGDTSGDVELANTAAIADALTIPMTVLWNPRVWTTAAVSADRAEAMLRWTKERLAKGDEVGLHLHQWTDYVRSSGVAPRTTPSWAQRGDGYDVPLTAYTEDEQRKLIDLGVRLMQNHGLPRPTSFRGGGQFADATTLRVLVAAGFTADCSAVPSGSTGSLRTPWNHSPGVQPYRPSSSDPSQPGDLPLLESPTSGGNTYGLTAQSIQPQLRANLAMLAPPGTVARERRVVHTVSHPGTITATERAAIEALFNAYEPLRYDRDVGPLRFVTLAQLARAMAR